MGADNSRGMYLRRRTVPLVKVKVSAAVVAIALVGGLSACGHGSDDAVKACQDQVRTELAYPADAVFDEVTPSKSSDGTVSVNGTVEAKNGFGLTKQDTYSCTASQVNGEWTAFAFTNQ